MSKHILLVGCFSYFGLHLNFTCTGADIPEPC